MGVGLLRLVQPKNKRALAHLANLNLLSGSSSEWELYPIIAEAREGAVKVSRERAAHWGSRKTNSFLEKRVRPLARKILRLCFRGDPRAFLLPRKLHPTPPARIVLLF
jgi:hypothetical protein